MYFTWRVWKFSKDIRAACLLVFLTISRFILATAVIILGFIYNTWESAEHDANAILVVTLPLAVFEDTLMASILSYYLYTRRTTRSTQLVTRLLTYIVATGALTSMVAIMELISLLVSRNSLLYMFFGLIQAKVYANSALLSLNQRQYQRKPCHHTEVILSELVIAPGNNEVSLSINSQL